MIRTLFIATATLALMGQAAPPAPVKAAAVKLWRLDCGTVKVKDLNRFSDVDAYTGQSRKQASSCYLIRHGDAYMLWDTGLPAAMKGRPLDPNAPMAATLTTTVVEQLATIGVTPEQISLVGVSHYHLDHIGQAAAFPGATLLIGKGDLDALKLGVPGTDAKLLAPWIGGTSKTEAVIGDKDVFGDGSVRMINLPGHTPGHHGLVVLLAGMGPVMLTGDVAHLRPNYDNDGVPAISASRADSLASLSRFKQLAKNLKATVIIQHEAADIAKLPIFPKGAE